MELEQAIKTVEYKIATDSERLKAGSVISMDISNDWPDKAELSEALKRKYPHLSVSYDIQPNERLQLLLRNEQG